MNIIVPYHEGFDVAANFVVQTVKALNDDSHNVHVIAFKYPKWFIAYFLGINSPKYTFPNLGKNVIVFPFLTLIPNFEFFPARVKSANKKLSILLLSIIINCLHKPIIWSFDYEDLDISTTALYKGYELVALNLPYLKHMSGATIATLKVDRMAITTKNKEK